MDDEARRLPAGTEVRRWVRMRRRLDAPPERVFRTWSEPEELARWLPLRVEGSLAVDTRTVLAWPDARAWWDVLEVTPNTTFRFRRPAHGETGPVTTVTVTVSPAGYGSWVELLDGPFELAEPGGLDAWAEAIATWAEALTMLRAHLDMSVDVRPTR
jgi:uncharacterized protein YndB with AHSA1/START domain